MNNIERDAFLYRAMKEEYSKAYHFCYECDDVVDPLHFIPEFADGSPEFCRRCNHMVDYINASLSTWEGFGKLFEWAIEQKWWNNFVYNNLPVDHSYMKPFLFANAVYKYIKETK